MSKLTLASQAEQSRIEEEAEKQDEADARERAEAEGNRLDEEEAEERKRKRMGKGKATGKGNRGSNKVAGNKTQHTVSFKQNIFLKPNKTSLLSNAMLFSR